jgi:hypothetical protein
MRILCAALLLAGLATAAADAHVLSWKNAHPVAKAVVEHEMELNHASTFKVNCVSGGEHLFRCSASWRRHAGRTCKYRFEVFIVEGSSHVDRTATRYRSAACRRIAGVEIPAVLGYTEKRATSTMRRAHLEPVLVLRKTNDAAQVGHVIAQSPKPGRRLQPKARARIVLGAPSPR